MKFKILSLICLSGISQADRISPVDNLLLLTPQDPDRVSRTNYPYETNGSSESPSISADGNKVMYLSYSDNNFWATDAGGLDTNLVRDVLLRDLGGLPKKTYRYSTSSNHNPTIQFPANGDVNDPRDYSVHQLKAESYDAEISDNGDFMVFTTIATALTYDTPYHPSQNAPYPPEADYDDSEDVFFQDLRTRKIRSVSSHNGPNQFNSNQGTVDSKGRNVAFVSEDDTMVSNVTANNHTDIFWRPITYYQNLGPIKQITVDNDHPSLGANGDSNNPHISGNGNCVVYESLATNLTDDAYTSTANISNIFLTDLNTLTTVLVSKRFNGIATSANSINPRVSDDCKYVVFESDDQLILPGMINGSADIYKYTVATGNTENVSLDYLGNPQTGHAQHPDLSGSGRYVVFSTDKDMLPNGNFGLAFNIYVVDTFSPWPYSVDVITVPNNYPGDDEDNFYPRISANGTKVVFESAQDDWITSGVPVYDFNEHVDIYIHNNPFIN